MLTFVLGAFRRFCFLIVNLFIENVQTIFSFLILVVLVCCAGLFCLDFFQKYFVWIKQRDSYIRDVVYSYA
jgi:hypothetical protein